MTTAGVTDYRAQLEREIAERVELLRPAAEEYDELVGVLERLRNGNGNGALTKAQQSKVAQGRTGRPGGRADELVRLVNHRPGKTVRDYGEFMGLFGESYTSLYQPLKRLLAESPPRIRKDGSQLWPVEA